MKSFRTAVPSLTLAALVTLGSPLAAQFVNASKLITPRSGVSAVTLPDGRILVAGGQRNYGSYTGPLVNSETYTLANGAKAVSSMNQARFSHTMTVLSNGNVLVTGGCYADSRCHYFAVPNHATAEIFNPTLGTWKTTGSMNFPRACHAAIRLSNGRVLVVGERREVECYNPLTGKFTVIAKLNYGRINPRLIPLDNGRVLVLGLGQADDPEAARTAEIFYPTTNTFKLTQPMTQERAMRFTATRLQDGRVLIAGGDTDTNKCGTYEIFDPATGLFTFLGHLSTDREHHTATLLKDGSVLFVGGEGVTNRVPDGAYGFMPPIVGPLSTVERFFPSQMRVNDEGYLVTARQGHAGLFVSDAHFGSVVVLGGTSYDNSSLTSVEMLTWK